MSVGSEKTGSAASIDVDVQELVQDKRAGRSIQEKE